MLMPGHSDRATVELCLPGSLAEPKFSLVLDMDLTLLQVVISTDFAWTTDNEKDLQMVSHVLEPSASWCCFSSLARPRQALSGVSGFLT